ncbi:MULTISPECIES: tyrosine-type recombinase/integrase [Cytobacillus]|uniref:tyrosine-type recombinase/integrase n=1 Tax=Cytobacillus TaxID=2675230 RepID=UPI001CD20149|nr:tyrosine-type recombinase/integrase [Cytobacillus kochii]MCA1026023.1 tyrosine-type recombinase/integrase [Cytobacillus kochii]MCM3321368.1 tyrosine-type recombinase/integrase [Cytobacillus kochii]MCM3343798.1 tyrosine-type recombinase/integrase [Cytobacillus kochii]MDM5207616.1 tyrosine-type recombinase/integrase [Cytobacillus kochii]
MNDMIPLHKMTDSQYLQALQTKLHSSHLLDEHRNLILEKASDQEFLEMFFVVKIFTTNKTFSPHTLKAYRSDAKTLLTYMNTHQLSFKEIGFPEVKAYNRYINEAYAAKSAIRKLEFFRRILDFGYETQFYKAHLSTWVSKPSSKKGHFSDQTSAGVGMRELTAFDAEQLISCFPKVVKAETNREGLKQRNLLIGYLLYTTGLRASELISLNWGSFRLNRRGALYADVIGKGNKFRSIPIREETKKVLLQYRETIGASTSFSSGDNSPLFFSMYNKRDLTGKQKRLTYPALYKIVKEAVRMAGKQTDISPHWFRHTFVTMLLENDVPLAVVKDWAGHADISTTNVYLERINQEEAYKHLEKVNIFQ